jgi:hypothetical protein
VIRAHEAQREGRAAGCKGTERHDRLGFIERSRQHFWRRAGVIDGRRKEPARRRVDAEQTAALERRARYVGRAVEIAREPDLEPPSAYEAAEYAPNGSDLMEAAVQCAT